MEHRFALSVGAVHLLDLFRGHPIAEIERIIGADHDVFGADHAFQIFDGLDAVDKIVEVKILQIFARRLFGRQARRAATATKSVIESTEMIGKKPPPWSSASLRLGNLSNTPL